VTGAQHSCVRVIALLQHHRRGVPACLISCRACCGRVQVLLLGTGGRTVYLGSPYAAMLYFTSFLGYQ
jgi:hypothetical protein